MWHSNPLLGIVLPVYNMKAPLALTLMSVSIKLVGKALLTLYSPPFSKVRNIKRKFPPWLKNCLKRNKGSPSPHVEAIEQSPKGKNSYPKSTSATMECFCGWLLGVMDGHFFTSVSTLGIKCGGYLDLLGMEVEPQGVTGLPTYLRVDSIAYVWSCRTKCKKKGNEEGNYTAVSECSNG